MLSVLCYINIKKRPVEQWEGVFFIVRHSLHYQIRPGILRFSVHILIALLVPVYLCTKIPLWPGETQGRSVVDTSVWTRCMDMFSDGHICVGHDP